MRTFWIIVTWLVLAVAATGLAWNVLAAADREVGAAPATPVLVVDDSSPSTTSPPSTSVGSTSSAPTLSPSTTSPSAPRATTATSTTSSISSTTAPSPSPSTTATTATTATVAGTADWSATTVPSGGGVVVVGHRPGEVRLDSATPAAGFSMEIDKSGPDEVRVEFENDEVSIEIRARWEDGALTTEVDS